MLSSLFWLLINEKELDMGCTNNLSIVNKWLTLNVCKLCVGVLNMADLIYFYVNQAD